jgi:hypothetical protein
VDLFHVWLQILLAIEGVFLSASINILAATAAPAGICLDLLLSPFAMIHSPSTFSRQGCSTGVMRQSQVE